MPCTRAKVCRSFPGDAVRFFEYYICELVCEKEKIVALGSFDSRGRRWTRSKTRSIGFSAAKFCRDRVLSLFLSHAPMPNQVDRRKTTFERSVVRKKRGNLYYIPFFEIISAKTESFCFARDEFFSCNVDT